MTLPNLPAGFTGHEYLRIGGGYGSPSTGTSPAGGLDVDNGGNLATSGDVTLDGALSAGSFGDITFTGDLQAGQGGVDRTWNVNLPGDVFWPDATSGPSGPVLTEFSGNRYEAKTLAFPTNENRRAYTVVLLPADYDGSSLKATIYWSVTASGASGDVRWAVGVLFADAGDPIKDFAGSTPFVSPVETLSAVGELQVTEVVLSATEIKPTMWLSLLRDGSNVFDTLDADALFIGMRIEYA